MLRKQLRKFIISGILATGTDLGIYYLLFHYVVYQHSVAKGISFICGTIVAYLFNKYITFAQTTHNWYELLRFLCLYGVTLVVNIWINQQSLTLFLNLSNAHYGFIFAFLLATMVSTVLNFIGQKLFVFNK